MTNAQIARVLREAAMYAHHNRESYPWAAIADVSIGLRLPLKKWADVSHFMSTLYAYYDGGWTPELATMALLFAAEAVDGE